MIIVRLKKVNIKITFGDKVRQLRLARKMTQFDLATLLKTDTKAVGRIERGEINTGIETAAKIANALNVRVKDLFDFD